MQWLWLCPSTCHSQPCMNCTVSPATKIGWDYKI